MSRGLCGPEADALWRHAQEKKARKEYEARLQKRVDKGPYKDASEETVERDVKNGLKETGCVELARIRHGNERIPHDAGISDLLGVMTVNVEDLVKAGIKQVGIAMAIEIKGSNDDPTGDQIQFIHRWVQAGALAGIARCFADVDRIIREYGLPGLAGEEDK